MRVVILGAGLTGLSCAYHLGEHRYDLFEAADAPGGLCRTRKAAGFQFDYTGHLLHLRDEYVTRLVLKELLPGVFRRHPRRAHVYSHGRFTPYPFQANTHGLPLEVVRECVVGFVNAPRINRPRNFHDWAMTTFGPGIFEHFMRPYNEKLWRVPLTELGHEWCSWSVPRPSLEQIVDGAIGNVNRGMGYNATFHYPRSGGIEVLPQAFADRCVEPVQTHHEAVAVDVRRKRVRFENGREAQYDRLVSTIPLDELLAITRDGPADWRLIPRHLRRVPILALNLGVRGSFLKGKHWVYFPEPAFPFYRVGVATNFEPALAPNGCAALYVEVSLGRPDVDIGPIVKQSIEALVRLGMPSEILVRDAIVIPCAYVVYDRERRRLVPKVLRDLRRHDILSTGRYGAWQYSYMERAILDGREAASWLSRAGR